MTATFNIGKKRVTREVRPEDINAKGLRVKLWNGKVIKRNHVKHDVELNGFTEADIAVMRRRKVA